MDKIYEIVTYIFDPLHDFIESEKTQKVVGTILVVVFLASLGVIELKRDGMLPEQLATLIPSSHFHAVGLAFTLVLILEVVALIFTLPCSVSKSIGKQLEILSLILLRNSFKELVHFPEPVAVVGHEDSLYHIIAYSLSSLAVFTLLGIYYKLQKKSRSEISLGEDRYRFVAAKKVIALVLLVTFASMGVRNLVATVNGHHFHFFAAFYTLLIFSDILVVLVSQRFLPSFHSIYRNSGYALCTLLMRLAMTTTPYLCAAMGVGASFLAVLITIIYQYFWQPQKG